MTETNFEFTVASDIDFEDLIADIGFENNLVAYLTQEDGFKSMRIRIFPPQNRDFWDFKLDEFVEILNRAKQRLWELRKDTEN